MEIECAALFELDYAVQLAVLWGDPAANYGVDDGFPFICAEPWCCDARVGDVENRDGEGLEGRRGRDREVYYLRLSVQKLERSKRMRW